VKPESIIRPLILTENYHPQRGGMAQSCDRIVSSLRGLRAEVHVAHFSKRIRGFVKERKAGGFYIGCPLEDDPAHAMNRLYQVLEEMHDDDPMTHVAAFGGHLALVAGPVYAAWLDVPLITCIRGNDLDVGVFSPKRQDILFRSLERSAAVCVVSRDKGEKIRALFREIQPVWIPNGIDLDEWTAVPSDRARAKRWRRDNVPEERRVLGVLGQMKRKKGGLFFLKALLASGMAQGFHLVFAGEVEEPLAQCLDEHGQEVSYDLFPFLDRFELLNLYLASDFVVIPSFYDGLPNVMVEAAALGIPLLASAAGGMGDFLVDGRHGFLFHPGDVHGCRWAIARAARASDTEMKCMHEALKGLAGSEFSHRVEAERYYRVFMQTLRRAAPSRMLEVMEP
jgi:glycosyltransferase involved in cell wall biosynthesis